MERVIGCLKNVFPECDPASINAETPLGSIPGWDSMNSVNFLMELENAFSIRLVDEILTGDQRVADVIQLLRRKDGSI